MKHRVLKSPLRLFGIALIFIVGIGVLQFSGCFKVNASSCDGYAPELSVAVSQELALRYWTYSPNAVSLAQQQGKVVLYFWAPWCSSCTALDTQLQENTLQIPEGVIVLRVPYDEYSELRKKYSVLTQHTFVYIDKDNNQLTQWVGGGIENFSIFLQ